MSELEPLDRSGMGSRASRYPAEVVDLALTAIATMDGNVMGAGKQLAEHAGILIPYSTLVTWKKKVYATRYLEIREKVLPQIKAEMAEAQEQVVFAASDLALKTIKRMRDNLEDYEIKDLPKVAQSSGIVGGINSQRASENRGDATIIVERKDPAETIKALQRLVPGLIVEGEAEEVPPKELGP